jgi:hypothetical protein
MANVCATEGEKGEVGWMYIKVNVSAAWAVFACLGLGLQKQTAVPAAICSHDLCGVNKTKQNNQ